MRAWCWVAAAGVALVVAGAVSPRLAAAAEYYPPFNVRLGTQTFEPKYGFTSDDRLVETAERIYDMGSDVVKIECSLRADEKYGLPSLASRGIDSLTKLVRDEPSFRRVVDMPFRYIQLWAYPLSLANSHHHLWRDGVSAAEADAEYAEIHALATHLFETYNGTGKTFLLGHWEGDWALLGSFDADDDPTTVAIQGMVDWLDLRQRAIDDARAATPHAGVDVWHYTEVNLVDKAMQGRATVTNDVLTSVTVDLVSYSAYDTIWRSTATFIAALDYIASKANTTGRFHKAVFIGEYGFPLDSGSRTPAEQASETRRIFTAALAWGCPFALYWQMYDNEADEGGANARGFWLIDNQNAIQPAYESHRGFLGRAHAFKNMYRVWLDRNPDEEAFDRFSAAWESFSTSAMLDQMLASAEYAGRVSDAGYAALLYRSVMGVSDQADADLQADLARLGSGASRSQVLEDLLDGARFASVVDNTGFARLLVRGTLVGLPLSDSPDQEIEQLLARLDAGASRSALWREQLDREDFYRAELAIRHLDEKGHIVVFRKHFIDISLLDPSGTLAGRWQVYR